MYVHRRLIYKAHEIHTYPYVNCSLYASAAMGPRSVSMSKLREKSSSYIKHIYIHRRFIYITKSRRDSHISVCILYTHLLGGYI